MRARLTAESVNSPLAGWLGGVLRGLALGALSVVCAPPAGAAPAASIGAWRVESGAPPPPQPTPILVFAAASLTEALDEVDRAFDAHTHLPVRAAYASSAVLAKQIEAGAPADAFISADREWADYLDQRRLLKAGSRRDVLANALVLIAPADSRVELKVAPHFPLAAALGEGRLATGDPDSVPAGDYARAALTQLGVWQDVSSKLVRAENVRAALAYVAHGEAALGIVYRTDALAQKRVRIVDTFPADTHPPITYPAAQTAGSRPEAARYLEFLTGEEARAIFARYGFTPLP
jgi:molybdate transport system substrate-binding protein